MCRAGGYLILSVSDGSLQGGSTTLVSIRDFHCFLVKITVCPFVKRIDYARNVHTVLSCPNKKVFLFLFLVVFFIAPIEIFTSANS